MFRNTLQPLNIAKAVYTVAMVAVFFLVSLATAHAAQVTLAWDASNPGTGVTGYHVVYGQASKSYTTHLDAGSNTQLLVTGLEEAKTYYFAVHAHNTDDTVSSVNSTELSYTVPSAAPAPSISATPLSGAAPLAVTFAGSSTGSVTTWSWNFGDGSTGTGQNPAHTYTSAGTYTVSLTATNSGGSSTVTNTGYITVTNPTMAAPVANFSATPISGTAPLLVTLTDTSAGTVSSRFWDLGDGATSTAQSVVKTYNSAGSYNVKLTVSNAGGGSVKSQTISVTATAPTANFTASPNSGVAPLPVTFSNSSTGTIVSYSWNFGDNTTSTEQNPAHTYANAGAYTVTLTATGPSGTTPSTKTQTITVSAASTSGGLVAAYNFEEASGATVVDASGKGNHGAITEAKRIASGKYGKALSFDGINDLVTVNGAASLDLTTGMTLEAWVYPTATMSGWRSVLLKEQSSGAVYYLHANSDSNQPATGAFIGSEQILRGGSLLTANQWVHLAATYDGATQRLYVNGGQVASRAQAGGFQVSSTGKLRIGGNSVWGEFFKGYLDEIRIYNRALSQTEIQSDMNKAVATSSPAANLIGDQTVGEMTDSIAQGTAEAFQKTAATTGMVTSLSVYVNGGSTSTKLVAGLYSDNNGHPGALIAQGTLTNPVAGAWNKVALPAASVKAGAAYWIAILSSKGILQFRDKVGGATKPSETSKATNLTTLPSTWTTGTVYADGPLSGYGAGY